MAGAPRRSTFDTRLSSLERTVSEMQKATRLRNSSIGSGGLVIRDLGALTVEGSRDTINIGPEHVETLGDRGVEINLIPNAFDGIIETRHFQVYHYYSGGVDRFDWGFDGDNVLVQSDQIIIQDRGGGLIYMNNDSFGLNFSHPNGVFLAGSATGVHVSGPMNYTSAPTTTSGANMNINTVTGRIREVTSARKYKQDIDDVKVKPTDVLKIRGRTWRDKDEVKEDAATATRYPGFIAEEVHEAGLTDFVVYDAAGNPDALHYDRFSVALLELAKEQQKSIDQLEQRVAALERVQSTQKEK